MNLIIVNNEFIEKLLSFIDYFVNIEAGANDYLAKPVETDKLLSLMRVWLYR